jgi:hypothetical protein
MPIGNWGSFLKCFKPQRNRIGLGAVFALLRRLDPCGNFFVSLDFFWEGTEAVFNSVLRILVLGGSRAFRTTPQVPKGWPSWFAGAPNVASAPSGPGFGTFAG